MIELIDDRLEISFPEVHPEARMSLEFQRTLRIPDDDADHPLPPGLGCFALRHVDDHAESLPEGWLEKGGVMLPMYQSEAMWLNFSGYYSRKRESAYPFALKIAAGKINAVTGEAWLEGIHRNPQDYVVVPVQPWLDGFCVEKGLIRQFVAMPLGAGYSAEEQMTGAAACGGVQIIAYPMKREIYEKRFPELPERDRYVVRSERLCFEEGAMGLAAGGRMRQELYEDPFDPDDWDRQHASRCFVHICNSLVWQSITDQRPPSPPPTAKKYTELGLPWFEYYSDDHVALPGGSRLNELRSISELASQKGDQPLPENSPVAPKNVKILRAGLRKDEVRDGSF